MAFRKAERKRAWLRLALEGPAGSGKTFSALTLARGLVGPSGRIALIDTEKGSGELYSAQFAYDYDDIQPPYSPDRYRVKLVDAAKESYDCVIVDSLSHAWSGVGGILDIKDAVTKASRSGNSFDAWRNVTPQHNALVDALLSAPFHLIVTIRTKTECEVVEDEKGKKKPIKIGTKPEQREGLEYEFTTVLDLSVDGHVASSSKDRTGIFDNHPEIITTATGEKIRAWLDNAPEAQPTAPPAPVAPPVSEDEERYTIEMTERFESAREIPELEGFGKAGAQLIKALPPACQARVQACYRKELARLRAEAAAVNAAP